MGKDLDQITCSEVNWAEINLDAIAANARALKAWVGDSVELMAVVKANAYGFGAVQVARTVLRHGASRLAVARVVEGVALRQAGIEAPILIIGYVPPQCVETIVRYRLTAAIGDMGFAEALSAGAARAGVGRIPVHIKIDTGLGRFGLLPGEAAEFVQQVARLPGLEIEGMYTHFAISDDPDKSYTLKQHEFFVDTAQRVRALGIPVPLLHEANSGGTLSVRDAHANMVRCGISLYGMAPAPGFPLPIPLQPALSVHCRVGRVAVLPAGSAISYGCTYVTPRPTRVALVLMGYGCGYRRGLSNKGAALIHGVRCPIVGRVCMDQFIVNADAVPDVVVGDEAVVIGRQGDEEITAEELGVLLDTNTYEIPTGIMPRVTRIYLQDGKVVEVVRIAEA